ncbi:hypothetical protein NDU88_000949 [Pleurodeles waltl]|uniref:Uncharacterized protein n=1 Tax=Pleurodeles waltl TaxID=8319 RepID=A0AAV7UUV1_PLEWA|nr:hypothetical protein NDU88_000949 [Pleurodeles waltl]
MCVEGQPMSRVAAGVTVAVILCLRLHPEAKSGWQLNGRSRSRYRRAASGALRKCFIMPLSKGIDFQQSIKKVFYYAIVKRNRLPTKIMFFSYWHGRRKSTAPLRLLQEASRLDLLAENMCVEGQPMSRVAAGVTVAVIPCLRLHPEAKSGWQLNGRSRSRYRRAASGVRAGCALHMQEQAAQAKPC